MAEGSKLTGKRVLLLGAETELGRAIAAALAEAGARLALVGATNDAETAFAVQRLARKLNADVSQAIDATNEMAVRVMVRQVAKALAGLDAVLACEQDDPSAVELLRRAAEREFSRGAGEGTFVVATEDATLADIVDALAARLA